LQYSISELPMLRAEFLAEASRVLALSFDPAVMLGSLAGLAVPAIADVCFVDLLGAGGAFTRVSIAHVDPAMESLLRSFNLRPDFFAAEHPARRAIEEGKSALVTDITPEMIRAMILEPGRRDMLLAIGLRTAIIVPLHAGSAVAGIILVGTSISGRLLGTEELALVEDLAGRASHAIENARLFRETREAVGAREEILSIVAHDLRNPLNTIIMAGTMLEEELQAPDRAADRSRVGMILRNAKVMNRLIGDLLEVKRMEKGRLVVEPRPTDARVLVSEALDMLHPMAAAASLTLTASAVPGVPPVLADPVRIHQVLSNLIGNAIKFTPAGGEIQVRVEAKEGGGVRILVCDTGPGIAPDQLSEVFGRFWQGGHNNPLGVGLGLSISRGIVEAHGGEIRVESRLAEGTTFSFWLPAAIEGPD
jgi:signal transduction histidine kinase